MTGLLLMFVSSTNPSPTAFSLPRYQAHQEEVALHMSHFFLDYLKNLYLEFESDLPLATAAACLAGQEVTAPIAPEPPDNPLHYNSGPFDLTFSVIATTQGVVGKDAF